MTNKKRLSVPNKHVVSEKYSFRLRLYVLSTILVLLLTTVVWSLLSAKLNQNNADHLVNTYLFQDSATFHGSQLPGQHSLLIKWPIFLIIKLIGPSKFTFISFTVGITIMTVAALAFIMLKIEQRPKMFGVLCLTLASTLLLVPTQPHLAAILPVNMAMLATRNLEYIVYVGSLLLLLRPTKILHMHFWLSCLLMTLLIASDKLFLAMSLGGALISLVFYALVRRWSLVSLAVKWLVMTLISGIAATAVLWAVNAFRILHIANESTLSPYSAVHSVKELTLGTIYAVTGMLTNFGANPAPDTRVLSRIPEQLRHNIFQPSGLSYIINTGIVILVIVAIWHVFCAGLRHAKQRDIHLDDTSRLTLMLIWTTLAAIVVFIVSRHYYPVDARYLSIVVFTGFLALARYSTKHTLSIKTILVVSVFICLGIGAGFVNVIRDYDAEKTALSDTANRTDLIVQALKHHPVDVLVGDYWRVVPAKLIGDGQLNILPLENCNQVRNVLSSQNWQVDINNHSFAYLLSLDNSLTNFPHCNLEQVISDYGRPNASVLIAGTLDNPTEKLLFYDHGAHRTDLTSPIQSYKAPSTVVPTSLDQLNGTTCSVPTVMNIVAHQDDDLLFLSPDLIHDIHEGHCVRTIFITAGDAGNDQFYWLNREKGSEAAYSFMISSNRDVWIERIIKVSEHHFITVSSPRNNPSISLIYLHLPDGNLNGGGFKHTHNESLSALENGKIQHIQSVDGQSSYTSDELTSTLESLMHTYQPSEIRTQANFLSRTYPDHSDHIAVGQYSKAAYDRYELKQFENRLVIPIKFYVGYPIHNLLDNVFNFDLDEKRAAFFTYSEFDGSVCNLILNCKLSTTYNAYTHRQYHDIN